MKKTKKPKVTIRGLQHQIKVLEDELNLVKKNEREANDFEYRLRKEITDLLMNRNNFYPSYSSGSSDIKSWSQIKSSISRLIGEVTKEGEMARWFNQDKEMELSRLWYLMRVVVGDPKLDVPVRGDTRLDIFGDIQPNK